MQLQFFWSFFISWNCRVCNIYVFKENRPSQGNGGIISDVLLSSLSPYSYPQVLAQNKASKAHVAQLGIATAIQKHLRLKVQFPPDHCMWHLFPLSNRHFRVSGLCMLFGVRGDIQRPHKLHRHHVYIVSLMRRPLWYIFQCSCTISNITKKCGVKLPPLNLCRTWKHHSALIQN